MKKHAGKIKLGLLVVLIGIAIWSVAVMVLPSQAESATVATWKHSFWYPSTYNPYIVLVDCDKFSATAGKLYDKTDGIIATAETTNGVTYAANAIAATKDDESGWWTVIIPVLPVNKRVGMMICNSVSPTEGDEPLNMSYFYSGVTERVLYSPDYPVEAGSVQVRQAR